MSAPSIHTSKSALSNFKRWLLIAVLAGLGTAAGAFFLCSYVATQSMRSITAAPEAELLWLRTEFKLTDAQYDRIKVLHEKYFGQCGLMCQRIAEVNARLDRLIAASHEVTPELASTMDEAARVQSECRRAMLTHIYEVAAVMEPSHGSRYLQMMKQVIIEPGLPSAVAVGAPPQ